VGEEPTYFGNGRGAQYLGQKGRAPFNQKNRLTFCGLQEKKSEGGGGHIGGEKKSPKGKQAKTNRTFRKFKFSWAKKDKERGIKERKVFKGLEKGD